MAIRRMTAEEHAELRTKCFEANKRIARVQNMLGMRVPDYYFRSDRKKAQVLHTEWLKQSIATSN